METVRTETYKGFEIEIHQDSDYANPFEDWDGEFPLMYKGGRNMGSKDFSDGNIDNYLKYYLSDNQITKHMSKILAMIEVSKQEFDEDYPLGEWSKSERRGVLWEKLADWITESLDNRVSFCSEFGIKHYYGSSTGYSQGDYADVFICWTPKFEKIAGVKYEDVTEEALESTKYLFDSWAWGDVFGYEIDGIDNMSDSCWGFYGNDHKKSGLIEHAEGAIDWHIRQTKKKKEKKLKAFIRNRVPLQYRVYG